MLGVVRSGGDITGMYGQHGSPTQAKKTHAAGAPQQLKTQTGVLTGVQDNTSALLLRWCQTLLTTMTYDVFEAFKESDYVTKSAEHIFANLDVRSDVRSLYIQGVDGENTIYNDPDMGTLKNFDNLHDVVGIYASNPADLTVLHALTAIIKEQDREDVRLSRKHIQLQLKDLVVQTFAQNQPTPYKKPKVTPLQKEVYTCTSFFLHRIGYVQSSDFFGNVGYTMDTFYNQYLQYYPDAFAYCLTQPVLTLCVYQFENGIVDPSLCTLFVCLCLISVTDASNIEAATGAQGQAAQFQLEHDFKHTVQAVLQNAYGSTQKTISERGVQIYDVQKVSTISDVFQHCYVLFSKQLDQLLDQCLRFNHYFNGVEISSAPAPLALHDLIQELPAFSLKLRFV